VCSKLLVTIRPPSGAEGGKAARPETKIEYDYDEFGAVKSVKVVGGSGQTVTDLDRTTVQQSRSTAAAFSPAPAGEVAWVWCREEKLADPKQAEAAVALAKAAHDRTPPARRYVTARALGAASLRAGDTSTARETLEAAAKMRKEPSPSVWLLLAQ